MAQDVFVHLAPLSITDNRKHRASEGRRKLAFSMPSGRCFDRRSKTINVNRDYPQALGLCRSLWGLDKSL